MIRCDSGIVKSSPTCVHYKIYNSNVNKEQYAELREKIIAVESENDKRIEVLMWGIGLIITLMAVIFGITIHNNKKAAIQNAQETARKEFVREFRIYKRKFNETFADIEKKKEEIESLKFDIEQLSEMIKAANIKSREINVNQDENSDTNDTNA